MVEQVNSSEIVKTEFEQKYPAVAQVMDWVVYDDDPKSRGEIQAQLREKLCYEYYRTASLENKYIMPINAMISQARSIILDVVKISENEDAFNKELAQKALRGEVFNNYTDSKLYLGKEESKIIALNHLTSAALSVDSGVIELAIDLGATELARAIILNSTTTRI